MQFHSFKKDAMVGSAATLMVIAATLTSHEDDSVVALLHALLDNQKAEVARLKAVLLQTYSQHEFGVMVKAVVRNRGFVRSMLERRANDRAKPV